MTSPANSYAKAFSIEYTGLILIILCFVAGAMGGQTKAKEQNKTNAGPRIRENRGYLTQFEFNNAFDDSSQIVGNEDVLLALVDLMRHHDLILEGDVYGGLNGGTSGDLSTALKRSVSLYKFFLRQGIKPDVIRILASGGKSETQVQLRVVTDKKT